MNIFRKCLSTAMNFRVLNQSLRAYTVIEQIPEALDIDMTSFQNEVVNSTVPVFLVFYQDWDLKSKEMISRMEKLFHDGDYHSDLKLSKLDVDLNPEIAEAVGYETIPTVFAIHDQQMIGYFDETIPEDELSLFVESLVDFREHKQQNPENQQHEVEENMEDIAIEGKDTLEMAEYFFMRDEFDQASKLYQNLIRNEKYSEFHAEAIAGLCQIELKKDPVGGIDNVKELIENFDYLEGTSELKQILANVTLAEKVDHYSSLVEPSEKEEKIGEACELGLSCNFGEALDILFELAEHDNDIEDLKEIIVAVFDSMDPSDELLKTYRQKLMNILL